MKRFRLLAMEFKSKISIDFAWAVRYVEFADILIKFSLKKRQRLFFYVAV